MTELSKEEKFILKIMQKSGDKMNYRDIQTACENEFEGVRLILKKLKTKGYVTFDGMIPGYDDDIELIKNE